MRWLRFAGFILGIGLIALLAFAGNGTFVDPLTVQDDAAQPAGDLSGGATIGQTFIARAPRLSAIQIRWIVADDFSFTPNSRVTFHLRQRREDTADLATVSLPLAQIQHNQFSRFDFPPLADSRGKPYYFFLDASQAEITRGGLSVWSSDDDALPDGEMYYAGSAADRDLAFRAFSSPDLFFALDAIGKTLARAWTGLPFAALIFLIPGFAFQAAWRSLRLRSGQALWLRSGQSLWLRSGSTPQEISVESLAMVGGLSLAMLSAGALVLFWLRLPVAWLIAVMGGLSGATLVIGNRGCASPQPTSVGGPFPAGCLAMTSEGGFRAVVAAMLRLRSAHIPIALFLAGCFAISLLALVVGFIQFAELPAPLWVDSYAHAADIKEFLEQGRLPLHRIYHLGYHSIFALLVQLSGMAIPQAMILVGQLIVVQIGLSFFAFGMRWTGSTLGGLVCAVCVWFLTPTPQYFITWGRYPLLLGTAILPIAFIAAMDLIDSPHFEPRSFFLAIVTLAGLAFAHIRLLAFYVVFVAIYFAWHAWRARRLGAAGRVALAAAAGGGIGALWLAALGTDHALSQDIGGSIALVMGIDLATALTVLRSHYGILVGALTAIGGIVALARRTRRALIVVGWFGALLALAALQLYVVNAEILLLPFVILMGFFPAALLIGELAQILYARMQVVGLLVVLLAGLFGAREMLTIVNPTTILFTRADERALVWLAANTPNDARVLVNSFAWYPTVYVPSDGGGWIPYFTNRAIVFAGNALAPDARARWLEQQQITYVYVGRRAGIWRARDFADAPERYTLVYAEEGVRIFRVNDPTRTSPLSGE